MSLKYVHKICMYEFSPYLDVLDLGTNAGLNTFYT